MAKKAVANRRLVCSAEESEVKKICPGMPIIATHSYRKNVGYVDLWDSFVGKEEMYARDGLHLRGKGAAAFSGADNVKRCPLPEGSVIFYIQLPNMMQMQETLTGSTFDHLFSFFCYL